MCLLSASSDLALCDVDCRCLLFRCRLLLVLRLELDDAVVDSLSVPSCLL